MKKNLLILFCIIICINKIHSQTNWELLNPKPTANTGKDVHFVTNNIGYIITSNELLETLDTGNTWVKKQNISSGNDMSFYNATGYIVGNYGYVLKSIDRGTSWNQISTGFNSSFNTVNIIDDNNIILSTSNSIVKTNDGGTTWEILSIPNSAVNKTSFTSSLVGHAVSNGGTILKTIDGGQNWYTTQSTNIFPSDFFTVYFVNETIGFATREHDDMYKTTDAGETWVEISGPGEAIYDFHFLDENNGFATGDHGATYKTNDSGTSWVQIFFQNGFVYNTSMYGIYFQDNNIGYATGARGRIIKTIDGGNTWTPHSENYNDFRQLQFINSNIGYAQSGSYFYKTTDSGDNWNLVGALSLGTSVLAGDFTFVNESIGYATTASTYGGHVFKTTDGGVTWIALNNGYDIIDEGITSIFFLDENIGFISGGFNSKKVMKTVDGGANWTQVSNQKFGHIQFVNDLVGYGNRIGNYYGAMYKTIDGGDTWNINFELEGEDINTFHFVDENNGYFVGDQGLIYKTNDGGTNWEELEIPYEWYTQVNFYSKNVGYIADEDGKLYKTENGGISWEYLTQQYTINSIELINDKIYTAGTNGKIYRSDVEFEPIILHINPAENISNSNANLTGNATSNGESISNIQFEYSIDYSFSNIISTTPSTVDANESLNTSIDLINLEPNTTYYYRLTGTQNSNNNSSQILSFTTLPDYEITTNFTYNYSSTTADISGIIISNGYDITNVEFQYGTSSDILNSTLNGTPTSVLGNTTENVTASLINLEPETQYFYRIKATHQGDEIYGDILSFTTYPEFNINLYSPNINGTDVTLSAYLTSYSQDITNIVFEYGTIDYVNNISTNPSQVNANSSNYVSATITNLDTNSNYYYRLKAMHNGEVIYSEERVFNFSGDIIIVSGTIEETQANSLELKGLINSYGAYLTNIYFEYGLTDSFGSSVAGMPNYAFGYNTNLITGLINNPLPNETYYYRLVATNNGNIIYSDTYQFKIGTLSLTDFDFEQEISIYPNPATVFVNIKSNISEKVKSIEFYNALGQRIYYKNVFNTSDIKINVSDFRKGLYFIKVNFESTKVVSSKLILN
ncbi:T9SS type A sorting domain-containing protein [Tenacibaculum aquimarinum]|uniref:T9SS type A sorting domain-containing protein n=1 Tax=Tenacibaculum aquimarinum TaxID=2910675 RepID=UPI001F0B1E5D|nr:YCF48-related protein [Tenacibaculum aquimarinum]MCH3882506.1 YCF48-related protein [Tenacibaculum aquimarinum]